MKLLTLLLVFLSLINAACASAPMKTPVPIKTLAPSPTAAPALMPAPTVSPTLAPTPTPLPTPYQDPRYPLTERSAVMKNGRYPEEKRLNDDKNKFCAEIDLVNQIVEIFERDENGAYSVLVREMICSTGIEPGNRSPRGTFRMGTDYKRFAYFVRFFCYAQYWSQIKDRIYFHSIPYSERDERYLMVEEFEKLGEPASHGCIRLLPDDAHWIYLYLCTGTKVTITDKKEPRPEDRARLLPRGLPEPLVITQEKDSSLLQE